MGLAAGAAVGLTSTAASASVAPGAQGQSPVTEHLNPGQSHGDAHGHRGDRTDRRTYSVGFVRGRQACERAATIGERRGLWDEGNCYRVGRGNTYLLRATDYQGRHRHG
ncbi:hypothetical protein ACQP00_09825 [Dactylosporangium sp. CS-047395]|uniref:hypothetical protein n=1 Tax=Dactylosporangium sp. CS-047395 TaxID=3239936 RepID=UPI003D914946